MEVSAAVATAGANPSDESQLSRARAVLAGGQRVLTLACEILVATALVVQVVMLFGNVVLRQFFHYNLPWTIEVAELSLVVQTFVGAALAYSRQEHVAVQALANALPKQLHEYLDAVATWLVLGISVLVSTLAEPLLARYANQHSAVLGFSESLVVLPLVGGMALTGVFAGIHLLRRPKHAAVAGVCVGALVFAGVVGLGSVGPLADDSTALLLMLLLCAVLIAVGVPIAFCFIAAALVYLYASSTAPEVAVALNMQQGVTQVTLLAIPLFIGAGFIMSAGGLSKPLIDSLTSLLGRLRGGLHHVLIVTMLVFSGLSGSKLADVAGVGAPLRYGLRERGFDPRDSAALIAASAAAGETIPPSVAMIVLGSVTTLSISKLFLAGLLPAVLILGMLMIVVAIRGSGHRTSAGVPLATKLKLAVLAVPPLSAVVILIGGIATGVATPTEVGSVAVVYGLVLSVVLYRELGLRELMATVVGTASTTGMILFLVSAASAFSWSLVVAGVPTTIVKVLQSVGDDRFLFIAGSIIVLIVLGSVFEGLAAILILGPILVPLAIQAGLNPIQYSIIFLLALGIGVFAPPIGVGLFTSSAIFGVRMESAVRPALLYLGVVLAGVIVVAAVPWFTTAL
jgi:tripartite ATP-independent transporter DctM subunit